MARAAVAALVLCAAVLVGAAHAGRVLEYQALEAGLEEAEAAAAALAPLAAASPPAPAEDVPADAGGGVREDGREVRERGTTIGDVLWFVLQWANEAASGGDRRKAY